MECPRCEIEMEEDTRAVEHTLEESTIWVCRECGLEEERHKDKYDYQED